MQKIYELLEQDRKIEAIKQYKELTGCSLQMAKTAVDAMEVQLSRQNIITFSQEPSDPDADREEYQPALSAVKDLIEQNRKLEAIKLFRDITGVDTKISKKYVRLMSKSLSSRRKEFENGQYDDPHYRHSSVKSGGGGKWLGIIFVVALVAVAFFLLRYLGVL